VIKKASAPPRNLRGRLPAKVIAMDLCPPGGAPEAYGDMQGMRALRKGLSRKGRSAQRHRRNISGAGEDFINEEIGVYKNCFSGWAAMTKSPPALQAAAGFRASDLCAGTPVIDGALMEGWDVKSLTGPGPFLPKPPGTF
jgi:hypothetical protein